MKCTACGTASPDDAKFCMRCGKMLKRDMQPPVGLPIDAPSPPVEAPVEEGNKPVDAHVDRDTHTIVADAKTNGQTNTPTSFDEIVPLPEPEKLAVLAVSDMQQRQEDPSPITDGPTLLVQSGSIVEEPHPPVAEVPTQVASDPTIRQEQTQAPDGPTLLVQSGSIVEEPRPPVAEIPTQVASDPTIRQEQTQATNGPTLLVQPGSIVEEPRPPVAGVPTQIASDPTIDQEQAQADIQTISEPTVRRQQPDITPQKPVFAAEQFGYATQLSSPAMPSGVQPPHPFSSPAMSSGVQPPHPFSSPAMSGGVQTPHPYQMPPGHPGSGEYANASGPPSGPYYPSYPAPRSMSPSAPSYPSYPAYSQAQPLGMYPPGVSGAEYPPMSAWSPSQTGGPATPGYPMMPPQATPPPEGPKEIARIAQPFPIWVLVASTIATLVILMILQLIGRDWADGAMRAATGAITIAVLLLVFAGVRIYFGMLSEANKKRIPQIIGSALAVVLLFVYSGLALIAQTPLHMAQARFLEGQRQWQQAVNQYQLAGETAPTSTNIARVYDEWGEALNQSRQYTDAINKFNVVIDNYTTKDEITRAQKGEAIAYYNLAQSQLQAQQYNDAVTNFETLQSRFADSPQAQNAYAPLATALLGKGKQDRATACKSAVPTYQKLAKSYSDTPEGKDAANELSLPQPVKGRFTSTLPTDATLTAVLTSTRLSGNMSGSEYGPIILNSSITTPINKDGTFAFGPQKQGIYDLAWVATTPSAIYYGFTYKNNETAKGAFYVADVGPLCAFDLGNVITEIKTQ